MANKGAAALSGAGSGAAAGAAVGSVVPGIGTAIGAVGGGIIGGLAGYLGAGSGDEEDEEAARLRAEAMEAVRNVDLPKLEEMKIALEKYRSAGVYNPELEKAVEIGESQMAAVQTDPRLKEMQMKALMNLSNQSQTGLDAQQAMQLHALRRENERAEQGKQQQILQEMQQRGVGGSGAELAARLASSQASADRASAEGDRLAAMTNMQALQALAQQGQLGGQIRSQDFSEASAKAQAADLWNQFKAQNQQGVAGRNVERKNQAQQSNLANTQGIMNANTDLGNKQQVYNKQQVVSDYERKLGKAKDIAGMSEKAADRKNAEAQANRDAWAGAIQTVGSSATSIAGGMGGGGKMPIPTGGGGAGRMDMDNIGSDGEYDDGNLNRRFSKSSNFRGNGMGRNTNGL